MNMNQVTQKNFKMHGKGLVISSANGFKKRWSKLINLMKKFVKHIQWNPYLRDQSVGGKLLLKSGDFLNRGFLQNIIWGIKLNRNMACVQK